MKKVTPYELATLASRIDPERCMKDPTGALGAAVELLRHAKHVLWCAVEEDERNEQESEEYQKAMEGIRVDWAQGTKEITGEQRRERAARKFTEFVKHKAPANLSGYKRAGFTLDEIYELHSKFAEWKKQPKGKQGRRISESDGRLRIGRLRLVATKPQKAA
jgi:hypothetical protein